jgi:outer membrane protein assembly factor BamE (lipoprotein component of BamABCDE complex)
MSIESAVGFGGKKTRAARLVAIAAVAAIPLAGCKSGGSGGGLFAGMSHTTQHGYVVPEMALEQIPPGSSRDQVLIALGTPSTTATFGGEVFYYISQTKYQAVAFMDPKVVDQRVVAVYFDKNNKVERVANYGLKDGKVFDFVRGVTPTGGLDQNFLQTVLSGAIGFGKK